MRCLPNVRLGCPSFVHDSYFRSDVEDDRDGGCSLALWCLPPESLLFDLYHGQDVSYN